MHPREFDMWRYNISELYALIYPSVPFYTLNLSLKNNTIHTWMIYLRAFTTYLCWSEGRGWRDILVYGRGSPRPNFSTFLPYSCFWGRKFNFGIFWRFLKLHQKSKSPNLNILWIYWQIYIIKRFFTFNFIRYTW